MSELTQEQKRAATTANKLLKKEIANEDVPQELVPLILESFSRHKKTMAAFEKYAKGQMMDGVKVEGWFLKPGATVRSFDNLVGLYNNLKDNYGCDTKTFWANCSMATGGVKQIIKDSMVPGTPDAVLETKVNELVEQYGSTKTNAPSMKQETKPKA